MHAATGQSARYYRASPRTNARRIFNGVQHAAVNTSSILITLRVSSYLISICCFAKLRVHSFYHRSCTIYHPRSAIFCRVCRRSCLPAYTLLQSSHLRSRFLRTVFFKFEKLSENSYTPRFSPNE